LLLSVHLPALLEEAEAQNLNSFSPNAFVRIEHDGRVILTMPYVEMGQGTYTSIPMLIAEELEVGLDQVQLEHAPPDEKRFGNPLLAGVQATGGSTTMRAVWEPMRQRVQLRGSCW
jgi:isoquinoline 1-oxidoreductase beta subunit